jgi:hypothetical protein
MTAVPTIFVLQNVKAGVDAPRLLICIFGIIEFVHV